VRGEGCTYIWWGNLRNGDLLGDPGVDARIILRGIFKKWDVGVWTGLSWLRLGTGCGNFKCGNEPSDSVKFGEFFDWLQTG
jgi:hypothetical protein